MGVVSVYVYVPVGYEAQCATLAAWPILCYVVGALAYPARQHGSLPCQHQHGSGSGEEGEEITRPRNVNASGIEQHTTPSTSQQVTHRASSGTTAARSTGPLLIPGIS